MRDYLYIPMGGSKVGSKQRLYFNLWFIFLVSGLWHGAAWNFVIWGAFHGFFLIIDRLFWLKIVDKIGKPISIAITFFIVVVGWVIFRAESFYQINFYLKSMFGFNIIKTCYLISNEFWAMFVIAGLFAFITLAGFGKKAESFVYFKKGLSLKQSVGMFFIASILLVLSISSISSSGFNPFIYFRF